MNRLTVAALAFLVLALSACATAPLSRESNAERQAAYDARSAGISTWTRWGFKGRLSMDDGTDGGSGQLDWLTEGKESRLDFRGTLGRGAWRLSMGPHSATLQRADGSRVEAESVEELVLGEVGWRLPVEALSWWVRGLRAPGVAERIELDEAGRIVRLDQAG